jgi:hypothetical protein
LKDSPKPGDVWFDVLRELDGDVYTLLLLPPNIDPNSRFWVVLRTDKSGRLLKIRCPKSEVNNWYDPAGLTGVYRVA